MSPGAKERVRRLVGAAARIADPADALGREARETLPGRTGLSKENVELCLSECLETHPSPAELDALCASVPAAPRAHVGLSAGVFTGAHRAIALGLAASADVRVRPSRRDPEMTRLLSLAAPGLFAVVSELSPSPSDHVFAYGTDETLSAFSRAMPEGVVFHGHGTGIGLVVVDVDAPASRPEEIASRVALDVVPFDQRGCLSPRLVLAIGSRAHARALAVAVAHALSLLGALVPPGIVHEDERAELVRHRDAWLVAGEVLAAGPGLVSFDGDASPLAIPPPARSLHVRWTPDAAVVLSELTPLVTSVAVEGPPELRAAIRAALPGARVTVAGSMQRPPFDGPVDRRSPFGAGPRAGA